MRYHAVWLIMGLFFMVASIPAMAQYGGGKWEISPFVGLETSGSVPVTNSLTINRLRADSGTSFGAYLDYSLTENAQAELLWNRNTASFSVRNAATGTYSKAFNSDIDQFHFGFLYMLRNSERKLRPFIAGGIGFTHDSNSGANPDKTAFSYGLGGGTKYSLTRHFGLRGDLRWVPTYGNRTTGVICNPFGFCSQARVSNYFQRVNFSGGIVLRF